LSIARGPGARLFTSGQRFAILVFHLLDLGTQDPDGLAETSRHGGQFRGCKQQQRHYDDDEDWPRAIKQSSHYTSFSCQVFFLLVSYLP
jgi:hypothetical protein